MNGFLRVINDSALYNLNELYKSENGGAGTYKTTNSIWKEWEKVS